MAIETFEDFAPRLAEGVFVHQSAVVIGNVCIGKDSSVWPLSVIRGDIHQIQIGERSSIQDGSVLHVTHDGPFNPGGFGCTIGNDVTVGHKVMLHGCTINDRVLIGMGSIIMDGVVVESDVIVGGGSLVPPGKVLKSGYLYVGSPVKQLRALDEQEKSFFLYTAGKYCELKNRYLATSDN
ncbi:MAG: gamma carbonic anhydrase family protein [Gammaproteobacteria bacterium]|nr:gamma carbonic anhydrase family protein [Gammaproteobacteria bacterium]